MGFSSCEWNYASFHAHDDFPKVLSGCRVGRDRQPSKANPRGSSEVGD